MIKEYIKYRKSYFFFYLCVLIFFPFIHFLYRLPMKSILYSCLIFTFFFIIWLIIDSNSFQNKVNKINTILDNITCDIQELPQQDNAIESKYQDIIRTLYKLVNDNILVMENSHSDQIEYYTMWVHQIKTPISAMRLAIQSREVVDNLIIDQELFKIEQYVEMALQYIKMKQLSSDLVIREYSLKNILHTSVKKYAALFIYKKLSIDLEGLELMVLTDSKWLSFIIEQLLSNAIKYTNQGGIRIYMEDRSLVIEDTGIGIHSEDMERIFEKGYTGYNGRLDKKASGIGLYLVKKVADSLAIKVTISSAVGIGTKAVLTFPEQELIFE
jgi:signal transduction histidine kinase